MQREESICQGTLTSTMYKSYNASENLATTLWLFLKLQLLLHNYWCQWDHLIHSSASRIQILSARPRTNGVSAIWYGGNSFTAQTSYFPA
jgi:hypothetical protein